MEGVSNPRAELPVNNAKYVRMCSEMYLGRKGIMFLGNFEGFDNLTDLWINDNEVNSYMSISLIRVCTILHKQLKCVVDYINNRP